MAEQQHPEQQKSDVAEGQHIDAYEVELCAPECLMRTMAGCAAAHNAATGEFAFDDNVRNAMGMVLLKYMKLVTRNY